jgi:hypothetical protein
VSKWIAKLEASDWRELTTSGQASEASDGDRPMRMNHLACGLVVIAGFVIPAVLIAH